MNKSIFILLLVLFTTNSFGQNSSREFAHTEGDTTYIMKRYVFGLLKSGPNRNQDSTATAIIQKGHLNHLGKLANDGKLVLAGPFEGANEYRGLLIFDVETLDEAKELQNSDPAIKAGRLTLEVMYWWGAKGTSLP